MSFSFVIPAKAGSASRQTNVWSSSAFNFNDMKTLDPRLRGDDDITHRGDDDIIQRCLGKL